MSGPLGDEIGLRFSDPDLILENVAPDHVEELDAALIEIHAAFAEEQSQGLTTLEKHWRAWTVSHERTDMIGEVIDLAMRARADFDVLLLLGVGGSDLAPRLLHEMLDDPLHNLLTPKERGGGLEIYFGGDTFDPCQLNAILRELDKACKLPRTLVNIVSRSGRTAETFAASLLVREAMHHAGVKDWRRNIVATTVYSPKSLLYQMHNEKPEGALYGILPYPEGVGGRFSAASPVGLFPLALTANASVRTPTERVQDALRGFARGHQQTFGASPAEDKNVAFRLAKWLHLAEQYLHKSTLLFCNYADNRYLGEWLTQLYSESLQERGEGLNLLPTRGPTGNHSILNGVVRGPRDKVVVFVEWANLDPTRTSVPAESSLEGELAALGGLPMAQIQKASLAGTRADFTEKGIPNATLEVPARNEACVFQLLRLLMDTVAVKGRLQGLHHTLGGTLAPEQELTYQQDGVEGYKEKMRQELARLRKKLGLPPLS
ncbi:MAG: hypothetical protein ACUVX8_12025 [Candidatus Zipacnadales bacterium]